MRTVLLDDNLSRTDAANGLVVVTERLPGVRSAAAGFWVRSASGHESPEVMGVSHLLEHMVFIVSLIPNGFIHVRHKLVIRPSILFTRYNSN